MTREAIEKLQNWYLENKRDLPWRRTKDPYHIFVSEIMLQQTQVETVIPYFNKFINKYPNIVALSNATIEEVLKDVEGLGYYRRFRNMHKASVVIRDTFNGIFPRNYKDVLSLPGVGKYTAGAIMSIAYNEPYGAVDGNVIRVLSRFYGIDLDMRKEKNRKVIEKLNQENIEKAIPEIYTQALMELGATICTFKNHKMELSPLKEWCYATNNNKVDELPYFSKLKEKKEQRFFTFILEDEDNYYLNRREEALLEGMYEWPQVESESLNYAVDYFEALGIQIKIVKELKQYKHIFTHLVWYMDVYKAILLKPTDKLIKVNKNNLKDLPMATAHKKIKLT